MNYLIISCVCLLIKFASFENLNSDAVNMSNITINHSKIGQMNSTQEEENSLKLKLENFRNLINTFYFPLIVTIGLIGNTLIIIILRKENKLMEWHDRHELIRKKRSNLNKELEQNDLQQPLAGKSRPNNQFSANNKRKASVSPGFSSTNYFLFGLAISDLIYNFILALLYLTRIGVYDILNMNYVCQTTIAITYICSFLSAAFTMLFTFQRFIAVVFPLKSATTFSLQSKNVIRRVIGTLVVSSFLIYSFSLVMYDTEPKQVHENGPAQRMCGINEKYTNLVYIIENTMDSVLTLIIPSVSIIIMNAAICRSLSEHSKDNFLNDSKNNSNANKQDQVLVKNSNSNNANHNKKLNQQQNSNSASSRRITKTLLIVSFAFVLLNSPYRLSKLISYISMSVKKQYVYSNVEFVVNEVLINLYFTSYSVNFFFYSFTGKKFRLSLKALFSHLFYLCFYRNE